MLKDKKYLFDVLLKFKKQFLVLIFFSISLSLLELLGVSVILPILDYNNSTSSVPFPLNHISKYFVFFDFKFKLQLVAILLVLIFFLALLPL